MAVNDTTVALIVAVTSVPLLLMLFSVARWVNAWADGACMRRDVQRHSYDLWKVEAKRERRKAGLR